MSFLENFDIVEKLLMIPGALLVFSLRGWAKAFAADKLGDPTPRNLGKLTLNPLVHIDFIGLLFIMLFGFGWTKPVPVNTRHFKKIKRDNAIFILSGSVACIALAFVAGGIFAFVKSLPVFIPGLNETAILVVDYLKIIFYYMKELAIMLTAFYLLPLPGLDGYQLIANFLPYTWYRKLYNIEKYSMFIFIGFILVINYVPYANVIFLPATIFSSLIDSFWGIIFALPQVILFQK